MTSQVCLNGKFCTKPWTQTVPKATQSHLDLIEDVVSEPESAFTGSEPEESIAGAAHYLTFNMNSGFWQVPMDKDSKQYTAFTLGSMGLYECESMPFGLCNAPPTF